jgi:hypothetical protein
MNLEAFGRAPTERLSVEKGGDQNMDGSIGKIMWQWMIVGIVLTALAIGVLIVWGGSCAVGWSKRNQVIANKCQCDGDTETGQEASEIDLDFSQKPKAPATDPVCTVWVLMEHLSDTREWIDTRVRCQR